MRRPPAHSRCNRHRVLEHASTLDRSCRWSLSMSEVCGNGTRSHGTTTRHGNLAARVESHSLSAPRSETPPSYESKRKYCIWKAEKACRQLMQLRAEFIPSEASRLLRSRRAPGLQIAAFESHCFKVAPEAPSSPSAILLGNTHLRVPQNEAKKASETEEPSGPLRKPKEASWLVQKQAERAPCCRRADQP